MPLRLRSEQQGALPRTLSRCNRGSGTRTGSKGRRHSPARRVRAVPTVFDVSTESGETQGQRQPYNMKPKINQVFNGRFAQINCG